MVDEITQRIEKRDGKQVIVTFKEGKEISVEPHIRPQLGRLPGTTRVAGIAPTVSKEDIEAINLATRKKLEAEGKIVLAVTRDERGLETFETVRSVAEALAFKRQKEAIEQAKFDTQLAQADPFVETGVSPKALRLVDEKEPPKKQPSVLGLAQISAKPPPQFSPEEIAEIRRKARVGEGKLKFEMPKFDFGFGEREPLFVSAKREVGERLPAAQEAFARGGITGLGARGVQTILSSISPALSGVVGLTLEGVGIALGVATTIETTKRGAVQRGRELRQIFTGQETQTVEEILAGDPISEVASIGADIATSITTSFIERPLEAFASGLGFGAGYAAPEIIGGGLKAISGGLKKVKGKIPKPQPPEPLVRFPTETIGTGRRGFTAAEQKALRFGQQLLTIDLRPEAPGSAFFSLSTFKTPRVSPTRTPFPHLRFRTRTEVPTIALPSFQIPFFIPPLPPKKVVKKVNGKIKQKDISKQKIEQIPKEIEEQALVPKVDVIQATIPGFETFLAPLAAIATPTVQKTKQEEPPRTVPFLDPFRPPEPVKRKAPIGPIGSGIGSLLGFKRRGRIRGVRKKYTPSVAALLLGIEVAEIPVGRPFGIRPLVRKRRKKAKTKARSNKKIKRTTKKVIKRKTTKAKRKTKRTKRGFLDPRNFNIGF